MDVGFLDFPAPLLSWMDQALAHLIPEAGRLVLWSVAAGVASMLAYWLASPQRRLAELQAEVTASRQALAAYDGDFSGLPPIVARALSTSLKHLASALGPALLGALPVLVLAGWLAGAYGYELPGPGAVIGIRAVAPAGTVSWVGTAAPAPGRDGWRIPWPAEDSPVRLTDRGGRTLLRLPLDTPVPIIHKRQWWNVFFANPLGSIPAASTVQSIEIDLPAKVFVPIGPDWMRGWLTLFILGALVSSVAVKLAFRIR